MGGGGVSLFDYNRLSIDRGIAVDDGIVFVGKYGESHDGEPPIVDVLVSVIISRDHHRMVVIVLSSTRGFDGCSV